MNPEGLSYHIRERARELGFTLCGITPARPSPRFDAYLSWLRAGMHGEMSYMARPDRIARRRDLNNILPGVQSLIVVGLNYATTDPPYELAGAPGRGRLSNYAWGADYHTVMTSRLESLAQSLHNGARGTATRFYADTGAILERSHAQQAGLGFIGKNTALISPQLGSYLFLGELLTTVELEPTPPVPMAHCGRCARCLTACPTAALISPYVLDARRCISYLTIELKGWIPRALRPLMGNWVYGCDICQAVCPWQRFAQPTQETALYPGSYERIALPLPDLLTLSTERFHNQYAGSALYRIKRERLVRNACVASGNSSLPELAPSLVPLLQDISPLIRGHAAWALGQLGAGQDSLRAALPRETDAHAQAEIESALRSS